MGPTTECAAGFEGGATEGAKKEKQRKKERKGNSCSKREQHIVSCVERLPGDLSEEDNTHLNV